MIDITLNYHVELVMIRTLMWIVCAIYTKMIGKIPEKIEKIVDYCRLVYRKLISVDKMHKSDILFLA